MGCDSVGYMYLIWLRQQTKSFKAKSFGFAWGINECFNTCLNSSISRKGVKIFFFYYYYENNWDDDETIL